MHTMLWPCAALKTFHKGKAPDLMGSKQTKNHQKPPKQNTRTTTKQQQINQSKPNTQSLL